MGRSPCCDKNLLKKGPWTQEEDMKLIQHIQMHGPGNWRNLPNNAGLQRCGKSCRLRWTNYLRPDIKRGRFSFEEEESIIQLHSVLGNKWSAIAARLPGRTDNEIKNYWNTHIRKRLLRNGIDPVANGYVHSNYRSELNNLSFVREMLGASANGCRMQGKRCSVPQLIVNACLVYEMVEGDRIKDGFVLLKWMLQKNMIFDTISYSLVVFATVKIGNLDAALEAYCEEGKIDEEIGVLEEMETFGCENGKTKQADEMMTILLDKGFEPDENTYSRLSLGDSKDGDMAVLMKLLFEMEYCSIAPNMLGLIRRLLVFAGVGD
ncbi:hypothetical protein BUALT_Bualt18G0018500 [Buddleja alternifolia]|uniref:Uncharacterized protein n=1 Tax=Buddleja alternifolia TaxID=168488 RepID=A0AAV6W3C7_9LAMI|nr:hypothetical protein BUALT_Bualt18G0018500 [Buddleja alternifolia]